MSSPAIWIGAISTAIASIIALWLGLRDGKRRREERERDARALIAYLSCDLEVVHNCLEWLLHLGEDMIRSCGTFLPADLEGMSQSTSASLNAQRLRDHADRFSVLPDPLAVHLSAAVGRLDGIASQTHQIALKIGSLSSDQHTSLLCPWSNDILAALSDLKPVLEYRNKIKDQPLAAPSMLKRCLRIIRSRQGS